MLSKAVCSALNGLLDLRHRGLQHDMSARRVGLAEQIDSRVDAKPTTGGPDAVESVLFFDCASEDLSSVLFDGSIALSLTSVCASCRAGQRIEVRRPRDKVHLHALVDSNSIPDAYGKALSPCRRKKRAIDLQRQRTQRFALSIVTLLVRVPVLPSIWSVK